MRTGLTKLILDINHYKIKESSDPESLFLIEFIQITKKFLKNPYTRKIQDYDNDN